MRNKDCLRTCQLKQLVINLAVLAKYSVLQAFRIGTGALAAVPCEVFAETGLAVKQESPLRPTCIMSLANAYWGYLPPPEQHELGGYETWPARSSALATDAETTIREESVRLLRALAGEGAATEGRQVP